MKRECVPTVFGKGAINGANRPGTDWRKLKVGDVLWHVNTSPPDYDSPNPTPWLELWRGVVVSINPEKSNPVRCKWDRVGGYANWVAPEYSWVRMKDWKTGRVTMKNINESVFLTAEEAIEDYIHHICKSKLDTLNEHARKLKAKHKDN